MSAIVSFERPLPVSIQLLSRMSTYAHVVESVLAIFLFWLFPSMTPQMPERRIIFRPRPLIHHKEFEDVDPIALTTPLPDEDEDEDEIEENVTGVDEDVVRRRRFSIPMTKSKSLSLMPFARRMSLPAKRISEHFNNTLSSPFQPSHPSPLSSPCFSVFIPFSNNNSPVQTPILEPESTGYFDTSDTSDEQSNHVHFEDQMEKEETLTLVEVQQREEVEYFEKELLRDSVIIITKETVVEVKRMKRLVKKAKGLLRLGHRS